MSQSHYRLYDTKDKQYFAITSKTGGNFEVTIKKDDHAHEGPPEHADINLAPGGTAVIEIELGKLFDYESEFPKTPYYLIIESTGPEFEAKDYDRYPAGANPHLPCEYTFSLSKVPLSIS